MLEKVKELIIIHLKGIYINKTINSHFERRTHQK